MPGKEKPGKSYWRGRLRTVDLLVLTSLDQLLFILKILFTFLTKQAISMRRLTVLSRPPQLVFPVSLMGQETNSARKWFIVQTPEEIRKHFWKWNLSVLVENRRTLSKMVMPELIEFSNLSNPLELCSHHYLGSLCRLGVSIRILQFGYMELDDP